MIGPSRPSVESTDQELCNGPTPVAGPSRVADIVQYIGPSMPPHLQAMRTHGRDTTADNDAATPSDGEKDDYGPALPPHLQKQATSIQGPSMPCSSDNESSDEDVGPALPPDRLHNIALTAAEEFRLREKERLDDEERRRKEAAGKGKREEWMMVPPTGFDFASRSTAADPGKITKRGFNQNTRRGGAAADKGQAQDMSLWTETPEERAQRLDDELMGKRKRKENATKQETPDERRARKLREQRNAEMRSQVDSANAASSRDQTLVEQHRVRAQAAETAEKERKKAKRTHRKASRSPSPPPAAFWDRDKMMGAGGRIMDEKQRKELVGSSNSGLSNKFGGGSYL